VAAVLHATPPVPPGVGPLQARAGSPPTSEFPATQTNQAWGSTGGDSVAVPTHQTALVLAGIAIAMVLVVLVGVGVALTVHRRAAVAVSTETRDAAGVIRSPGAEVAQTASSGRPPGDETTNASPETSVAATTATPSATATRPPRTPATKSASSGTLPSKSSTIDLSNVDRKLAPK
jgi:hypothetical protein